MRWNRTGGRSRDEDPATSFAARLRELRIQAGSPSFRELSKITHYSSSALAEATSGKRLPSEAIVKAFVTGCGADPDEWLALLRQAAKAASSPAPAAAANAKPAQLRWLRAALAAGAACVLLAAGTAFGAIVLRGHGISAARAGDRPGASPAASLLRVKPAADGADPIAAGCVPDARLTDKVPVLIGSRQIGALELYYSARCAAGWARAFLYPGEPTMLGEVTVKASDGRLAAFADPLVQQVPIYTNVIRAAKGQCLGAYAVFHPPGHAPVNATLPCQAPTS